MLAVLLPLQAWSAPGAHGPNGEHLDAPNGAAVLAGSVPRFEAKSEAFELVARLAGGELSMFINRYQTNEPVNNAKVELELGNLKATAPFHADQGDYAVADEAFLKAVSTPGEHAIVITLTAGTEADLLEGTLTVPAEAHGHDHDDHGHLLERVGVGAAVVALVGGAGWMLRRRRKAKLAFGGGQ